MRYMSGWKCCAGTILVTAMLEQSFAWSLLRSASDRSSGHYHAGTSRHRRPPPCLYNVPPPAESDTVAFTEYANKQSPPQSFYELQQDAVRATRLAISDHHDLLEVEFPPLPAAVLEMDDVSAYDVVEANLKLALDYAKGLLASEACTDVALLFPDAAEAAFAVKKAGGSKTPYPNIQISSLLANDENASFKPEQLFLNLMGKRTGVVKPIHRVDLYVIIGASAQELPDVEDLYEQVSRANNATVVCFNLKLDTLRGDLGAPAFPGRDFHDRFLSRIKPVYYLRTRQYSRSTSTPPFMVNYQGCLFRAYPGHYQTLLDTGTGGRYRRLMGSEHRPALGMFKQQLTDALKESGVLVDEGKTFEFFRTGYKATTWWEEERPEANDAWRT